jgi:DNA (cytosine-5)-methyltransferase 1
VIFRPWSMLDLDGVEKTGLRVASLFSGCGGSSLGYRLAGYEVVYANEFIPLAARTYRANSPSTIVDERDIRTVSGHELRERFGEIDLLDGSPPCASFSIAGQRSSSWGQVKPYSSTTQRTDDLFDEYARVVEELRPRSFVAENVAGFSQGVAIGYARRILARLRAAGYRVEARLLNAQWLGVPQARRRTIIVGVRNDLRGAVPFPKPFRERVSLRTALGPHVRGQICPVGFNSLDGMRRSADLPSLTVGAGTRTGNGKWSVSILFAPEEPDPETGWQVRISERVRRAFPNESLRYLHLSELRRVQSFPEDFVLVGSFNQRWERIGRAVPPLMMRAISSGLVEVLS